MSEYKVSYTEVPPTRRNDETYSGVLIHIRPPVQLNPDAVAQYLTFGDLEPLNLADWEGANGPDVKKAVLLGSTAEQTTIYASVEKEGSKIFAEQAAKDTVKLLQFMGATAMIDHPPTPDA